MCKIQLFSVIPCKIHKNYGCTCNLCFFAFAFKQAFKKASILKVSSRLAANRNQNDNSCLGPREKKVHHSHYFCTERSVIVIINI